MPPRSSVEASRDLRRLAVAHYQEPMGGPRAESLLQDGVLAEINAVLNEERSTGRLSGSFVVRRFGLDICVFMRHQDKTTVKFFELKAFAGQRPGGIGFGNQRGEGVQIDLLQGQPDQLLIADEFIRWIIWDATQPKGSKRFACLTSTFVRSTAMGAGVTPGKQNNFRIHDLMANAVTWDQLSNELKSFLGT